MDNAIIEQLWEIYDAVTGSYLQIAHKMRAGDTEYAEQQMISAMNKLIQLANNNDELRYLIYTADRIINTFDIGEIKYILGEIERFLDE